MADERNQTEANDTTPRTEGQPAGPAAQAAPEALEAQPHHEVEERLAAALAEAAEFRDQFLRAKAETENVRRRAQDDVAKAHKFAIEGFAEALLPVKDSLELALKTETPNVETMREGVDATLRLLASAFEKNRLLELDPAGQKFDPNLHQAISMVPGSSVTPPVPANHVVSVLQKGYTINDRVLRPALVTVAQG
ncbi:MAG: nucleotide exchange factor GrpE [Gammaproteobacteria bacterium]